MIELTNDVSVLNETRRELGRFNNFRASLTASGVSKSNASGYNISVRLSASESDRPSKSSNQ